MSYLEDVYEKLPQEIKDVLLFEEMKYFIFNGPKPLACIKEYMVAHPELDKDTMAVCTIRMLRNLAVERGIATEQDLEKGHERVIDDVLGWLTKHESEIVAEVAKRKMIQGN
ncbi:MAG: hypothetical protein V4478_00745 [Patescibacteria group bacterium]